MPATVFQHTAARRRLVLYLSAVVELSGFNTQPPEGGWDKCVGKPQNNSGFNTQPPEGGWAFGAND